MLSVARLDPLRVEVVLPAERFGTFAPGDGAWIEPELGGEALAATIERVDPLLDTRSGTFGVRLLLANPDRTVVAGQRCTVRFLAAPHAARPARD